MMKFTGISEELAKRAREVFGAPGGAEVAVAKREAAGYTFAAKDGVYTLSYGRVCDFFRAAALLADQIGRGARDFVVSETPKFALCGVMLDVSRNAVPTVETVKDVIRRMAKMGLNELMLYTEDTYEIDGYPYFGYMRGAYTKAEIKEIVAYAEAFGIETIPCIQTLGHLRQALKWAYAKDLRDTDGILLCAEEKTYAFIEAMIKSARECYRTDKIHIGMDEASGVGSGAYLKKHGYVEKFDILFEHLKRVESIVEKYGFKPMMWSDMFFRLGSETDDYYDGDAVMPDNIGELIPEKMSMVFWDYYHNDKPTYDAMIRLHGGMKREIVFAGGVWTWNGLCVNYDKTFATTRPALESCIEHGVRNVFATMWGDDGAECSVYAALLGMQLYAEYNYGDNVDDAHLAARFKACTGYDMDAFLAIGFDSLPEAVNGWHLVCPSKQVFYQDVLIGLLDKNYRGFDYKTYFKGVLDRMEALPDEGDLQYLFDCYRVLARILYEKCDLGIRVTDAYAANDRETLAGCVETLKKLAGLYDEFHEKAADVWYRNNKPFGFEVIDARMGGAATRIIRAAKRLTAYLEGRVASLPELEAERYFYTRGGNTTAPALGESNAARIMSASN